MLIKEREEPYGPQEDAQELYAELSGQKVELKRYTRPEIYGRATQVNIGGTNFTLNSSQHVGLLSEDNFFRCSYLEKAVAVLTNTHTRPSEEFVANMYGQLAEAEFDLREDELKHQNFKGLLDVLGSVQEYFGQDPSEKAKEALVKRALDLSNYVVGNDDGIRVDTALMQDTFQRLSDLGVPFGEVKDSLVEMLFMTTPGDLESLGVTKTLVDSSMQDNYALGHSIARGYNGRPRNSSKILEHLALTGEDLCDFYEFEEASGATLSIMDLNRLSKQNEELGRTEVAQELSQYADHLSEELVDLNHKRELNFTINGSRIIIGDILPVLEKVETFLPKKPSFRKEIYKKPTRP